MTIANVLLYIALIGFVLFKKVQGRPLGTPKKLLMLPVILTVLGFEDATHGTMKPIEIAVTVIGAAVSLGLGALRGRADKLSIRDGVQFVQWGKTSLMLFFANLLAKLVLDLLGVAGGGTISAAGKSLLFTLGLTLVGEAAVLCLRSTTSGSLFPPRATGNLPS
jgi:hypothetical protein